MLSENFIRYLAELINGDIEGMYSYKSGPKLVKFFNENFNYSDIYGQGFPSRWLYTYNKIVELLEKNELNKLFNIILNKNYIMRDLGISEVEAIKREREIYDKINEKALFENYYLTEKNGNYKLIKKDTDLEWIGGGGFANIYLQKSTGKIVKKLKEEFMLDKGIKSRFKREFAITNELNDLRGVIKVYRFDENNYSYTMEKAEKNLETYIQENELLESQKLSCIFQILDIMEKVHMRKIIHRDISPNNILILNGMIVISDFGLGKDLNMFTSHQTVYTNSVGQYWYCDPEQFMLLKDGDFKSDVYSLGRVINFIFNKDPRKSNHILRSVSEKATSENSAFRYSNAGELYNAVKKCIQFHNDKTRIQNIKEDIEKGQFNEIIEEYIYEQDAEKLLDNIAYLPNFKNTIMKFISIDSKHATFFIETITDKYERYYHKFADYDNLANIMFQIIIGKYEFPIKELAAKILKYIAEYINRYEAQRLINIAIENGIDPFIEEILKES